MQNWRCGKDLFDAWKQIGKSARLLSRFGRLALEEFVREFLGIAISAMEKDDGVGVFACRLSGDEMHVDEVSRSPCMLEENVEVE